MDKETDGNMGRSPHVPVEIDSAFTSASAKLRRLGKSWVSGLAHFFLSFGTLAISPTAAIYYSFHDLF